LLQHVQGVRGWKCVSKYNYVSELAGRVQLK